jgi:hypothetical protein
MTRGTPWIGGPLREPTCPTCDMVRRHQPGCPYEGLSMHEAREAYRAGMDGKAWTAYKEGKSEAQREAERQYYRDQYRRKHRRRDKHRQGPPQEEWASHAAPPPPADAGADQVAQHHQEADSKDS